MTAAHDEFCPPALGKPEPPECPMCLHVSRIRHDEQERIRIAVEDTPIDNWNAARLNIGDGYEAYLSMTAVLAHIQGRELT